MSYSQRIEKIRVNLINNKADAILVSSAVNIYYLTGYDATAENDRHVFLFINNNEVIIFSYEMFLEEISKSIDTNVKIYNLKEKRLTEVLNEKLKQNDKLLYEAHDLKVEEYKKIKSKLNSRLYTSKYLVEKIRQIKDSDEISKIKQAVEVTDKVYESIKKHVLESNEYSEEALNEYLYLEFKRNSAVFGFSPIIAFNESSALPHYKSKNIKLQDPLNLLLDLGGKLENYSGDLTRNILFQNDPKYKSHYQKVLECSNICINMLKPGVDFRDVHFAAVKYFAKYNLDKYFIHSIGHGLGLDIHEFPFVAPKSYLQKDMIITIEPGIYIPGSYGIRIENVLLISENGAKVLSNMSSMLNFHYAS